MQTESTSAPSRLPILDFIQTQPGWELKRSPEGRSRLDFDIGSMHATIQAIPSPILTPEEWRAFQTARQSYIDMWGGNGANVVLEDIFDGRDPESPYHTVHYISTVIDREESGAKIVTMRKVGMNAHFSPALHLLPDDISFWKITHLGGQNGLLQNIVSEKYSLSDITTISRGATWPFERGRRSPKQKDRSTIGFCGIQLLAMLDEESKLIFCQICPEFQTDVMVIDDERGQRHMLAFQRTERTFELDEGTCISLNNNLEDVRYLKTHYPGYWIHNGEASRTLSRLAQDDVITLADFLPAIDQFFSSQDSAHIKSSQREILEERSDIFSIINILTGPRYFKYLISLIKENSKVNAALIDNTIDGPFSASMRPPDWAASAMHLLQVAQRKYGTS